jgi:thiamine kinase-like enzyme
MALISDFQISNNKYNQTAHRIQRYECNTQAFWYDWFSYIEFHQELSIPRRIIFL